MKYCEINWSPFATNVLDAVDYDLCTPDGQAVDFKRTGAKFVLAIGDDILVTDDNIQMSYWMNMRQIGGVKKQSRK